MACFHPLSAWQTDDGDVVFVERGSIRRALTLPCGQCVGCRLERSRQWAVRCVHESQMHDFNSFVTLTYSDEALPTDLSLRYRDFQLFIKRVRKRFGRARFYMCGEYGDTFLRPHFHACLFGIHFVDRVLWSSSNDVNLYRSTILDGLWPFGFCSIGDVTFESAAYVARYCMKKVTGPQSEAHYRRVNWATGEYSDVVPEFTHMSLKPGIGADWLRLYYPEVLARDGIVLNGMQMRAPRYYDKYLSGLQRWDDVEYSRYQRAVAFIADSTPERLAVREAVVKSRLLMSSRSLE